jgi:tripartite-type tricarboxylate transporter receptor subunit TctC
MGADASVGMRTAGVQKGGNFTGRPHGPSSETLGIRSRIDLNAMLPSDDAFGTSRETGMHRSPHWLISGLAAALSLAAVSVQPAAGQEDWPSRAVTVVVPFAAGGNTDTMARLASQKLADVFKQSFVVENKVGAGGAIAAGYVLQQPADGYTLFFAAAPQIAILPYVQKVSYDPLKDFAPVSVFGTGPFILAIRADIPAKTVAEFVAFAKQRKINYGSGGTGTVGHLSGALFVARAGIEAVHVPFRGGAPAMTALLGGQVDMYFGNAAEIIPHAESGKARVLAVAADRRLQQLPNVPTVNETYPNFSINAWNGFMVRTGTPRPVVDKLAKEVIAAARDPAIVAQLTRLGIEPNGTTPAEMAAQIAREQPQFNVAIDAAALKQP